MRGTPSMGRRNRIKVHIKCRRCGQHSYNVTHKRCAHCGYPDSRIRSYNWAKSR
ncbi:MAG: 50S ribosomal protein L37e [Candidatus Thermoplasmatota archaeon]|nr:50S ribosomal protein L37e [Candidatus Thermoplasmatota archaeon]MCW6157896.1 50S ribosomal protein L37e [Thermoplasmatales archaeon]